MSSTEPPETDFQQRDSMTLTLIGGFFIVFATLVLAASLWEPRERAVIVNIGAGALLAGIGALMVLVGWRSRRRQRRKRYRRAVPRPHDGEGS